MRQKRLHVRGLQAEALREPERDRHEEAVQVLTVHKAKGLEFAVVLLLGCADGKFPVQRRRDPLELPAALVKDPLASGDAHMQEERRLFYVAMTRAKDELLLSSAADYGTARPRKLSRFVVEALDLPSPSPVPRRPAALEALARSAPEAEPLPGVETPLAGDAAVRLAFGQIDDFETCPLKYRYVHVLRVPLLTHNRVVYGNAVHKAVQRLFRPRLEGRSFSEDDLVAAFREAWISEGFLSREHEEQEHQPGQ